MEAANGTAGHALAHATVTLLYADDREQTRKAPVDNEGSFRFEYVPEDSYILRVSYAKDEAEQKEKSGCTPRKRSRYMCAAT